MSLLQFSTPQGDQVLSDQRPQKGAGSGLSFDQLGGPEYEIGRVLYPDPEVTPGLVFTNWLSLEWLYWTEFNLDVQSGGSFDLDADSVSLTSYDMDFAAGASLEPTDQEFTFVAYDLSVPAWLDGGVFSFEAYTLDIKAGTSVNVENQSWTFTAYDLVPSASPPMRLTYVGGTVSYSTSGATRDLAAPAGLPGDILLAVNLCYPSIPTAPSGFSDLVSATDVDSVVVRQKITSSENENVSFTGNNYGCALIRLRTNKALTSIVVATSMQLQFTDGNPAQQTQTINALADGVVVLATSRQVSGVAAFSVETPTFAHKLDGTLTYLVGVQLYDGDETKTNQIIDKADQGSSNTLSSVALRII